MSIIIALIMFSILVVVHEFGHYYAAIKNGVKVEEFAIGMGPKLLSWKGKNALFTIRILPIGGYCKMVGEDESSDDPNGLCNKSVWARMIVVVSGALLNIVYAILVLIFISWFTPMELSTIKEVSPNYPAEATGVLPGDQIISVNDKKVTMMDELRLHVALDSSENGTVNLGINRNGEKIAVSIPYIQTLLITTQKDLETSFAKDDMIYTINGKKLNEIENVDKEIKDNEEVRVRLLGGAADMILTENDKKVLMANQVNVHRILGLLAEQETPNFLNGIVNGLKKTVYYVEVTYLSLYKIVSGQISSNQIAGPVGIVKMMGDTYNNGLESSNKVLEVVRNILFSLLVFSAMLSINLGIINLLPLPALDGGRLLIMLVEVVRKKPMDVEKEGWIHFVGFVLLMLLMVFVLFNDIARIIKY